MQSPPTRQKDDGVRIIEVVVIIACKGREREPLQTAVDVEPQLSCRLNLIVKRGEEVMIQIAADDLDIALGGGSIRAKFSQCMRCCRNLRG